MNSFITKSFTAVGNFLGHGSVPDAQKAPEASPARSDAGSPFHERSHKPRATHRQPGPAPSLMGSMEIPIPGASASPERRPSDNRRKTNKSADELRLMGDYAIPADAVILHPPGAVAGRNAKPTSGGHRPMNTLMAPKISSLQAQPRPVRKTYGKKISRPAPFDLSEDPIADDSQSSPRKRRKTADIKSDQAPIHILEDDALPISSRRSQQSSKKRHDSQDTTWSNSNYLGKSQFLAVEGRVSITREPKRPHYNGRRTSLTSSKGETGPTPEPRASASPAFIDLSDGEQSNCHQSPITFKKDVMDSLSGMLSGTPSRTPRRGDIARESFEQRSRHFPISAGERIPGSAGHDTHSDYKSFIKPDPQIDMKESIFLDKRFSPRSKKPTPNSQNLHEQFVRDDGSSSDDGTDELAISLANPPTHPRKILQRPSTKGAGAANSRDLQPTAPKSKKKPAYALDYLATHGMALRGPDITLVHDPDLEAYYVRAPTQGSPATYEARAMIETKKILRRLECPESRCVRLSGSKSGTQQYWFDLQFAKAEHFSGFVRSLSDSNVRKIQRSSSEMMRIFRNPLGSTDQQLPKDQKIALLSANKQRRTNGFHELENRGESSGGYMLGTRTAGVVRKLQASAVNDNPTKKLRTAVTDSDLQDDNLDPKPSTSNRRTTRASLNSNTTKAFCDASPPPPRELKYSEHPGLGKPWEKPVEYPLIGRRKATIPFEDLQRLDNGEFLNDALIEFYMLWAYDQAKVAPGKVHLFNTYFYATLSKKQRGVTGVNYSGVARWVKDDLFSYDYAVVPVNEDTHWYVAIICNLSNIEGTKTTKLLAVDPVESEVVQLEDRGNHELQENEAQATETLKGRLNVRNLPSVDSTRDEEDFSPSLSRVEPVKTPQDRLNNAEESGEMPGADVILQSRSGTPSRGIQMLSIRDEPSDSNIDSPFSKPVTSSAKGKRRAPPPRKYDPDQPVIIILDSLDITHPKTVKSLKDYIHEEAKAKRKIEVQISSQGLNVKEIPKQSNYCDCGIFVLLYLRAFFDNPREFVTKVLTREMKVEDWTDAAPSEMRNEIRNTLFKLHDEQDAMRKREKALKKKTKKEPPEKNEMKENEEEEPIQAPKKQIAEIASPSLGRRTKSPQLVNQVAETADMEAPPYPSIEDQDLGITSPTLLSRSQEPEGSPTQSARFNSTIPETPPSPPRQSRLGGEAAPIEIDDSQPPFSHHDGLLQDNGQLSDDLFSQLVNSAGPEPTPLPKIPESGRLRRIIDVDDEPSSSFDAPAEDFGPAKATRMDIRRISRGRDRAPTET